jgi:hypothetical protein
MRRSAIGPRGSKLLADAICDFHCVIDCCGTSDRTISVEKLSKD